MNEGQEKMHKPSIMIATPAYTGSVRHEHYLSAVQTQTLLTKMGVDASFMVSAECPWVGHARASIVAQFMVTHKHSDDYLLMIDQDVSWNAEDVVRCMKHNVDFVSAVQRDKHTQKMMIGAVGKKPGDTHAFKYDPFRELLVGIGRVATCWIMLKRRVFEKMIAFYPEYHCEPGRLAREYGQPDYYYGFFEQPVIPRKFGDKAFWPGEDTHFCDLWMKAGGEIFVDPWVALTHTVYNPMPGRLADEIEGIPPRESDKPAQEAAA